MKPRKKILYIVGAIVSLIVILNLMSPYKIETIPDYVYTEVKEGSIFDDLLHGNKKITWIGAKDCPYSRARTRRINIFLEMAGLADTYSHTPILYNSYSTSNAAEIYLIDTCSGKYCVTLPDQRQIIILKDEKALYKILPKFSDR